MDLGPSLFISRAPLTETPTTTIDGGDGGVVVEAGRGRGRGYSRTYGDSIFLSKMRAGIDVAKNIAVSSAIDRS